MCVLNSEKNKKTTTVINTQINTTETELNTESVGGESATTAIMSQPQVATLSVQQNESLQNEVNAVFGETHAERPAENTSLPDTYSDPEKSLTRFLRFGREVDRLRASNNDLVVDRKSVEVAENFTNQRKMRAASASLIDELNVAESERERVDMAVPFLQGFHTLQNTSDQRQRNAPASKKDLEIRDQDRDFLADYTTRDFFLTPLTLNKMSDKFMEHQIPVKSYTRKYVRDHALELADRIEQAGALRGLIRRYEQGKENLLFRNFSAQEISALKIEVNKTLALMDYIRPMLMLSGITIGWEQAGKKVSIRAGADLEGRKKRYYEQQASEAWERMQSIQEWTEPDQDEIQAEEQVEAQAEEQVQTQEQAQAEEQVQTQEQEQTEEQEQEYDKVEIKAQPEADGYVHNRDIQYISAGAFRDIYRHASFPAKEQEYDDKYFSQLSEIYTSLTQSSKDALFRYTDDDGAFANSYLRGEFLRKPYKHIDRVINHISEAINKSALKEDTILPRGCNFKALEGLLGLKKNSININKLSDLVGKVGRDEGYLSCGSTKDTGMMDQEVNLYILAPKGTKALYCEPFSKYGNHDWERWDGVSRQEVFSAELETLLQRGTSLQVMSAEYKDGKVVCEMLVTGQKYKIMDQ